MDVIVSILDFIWSTYVILCIVFTSLILWGTFRRYRKTGTIFESVKPKTKIQNIFPKEFINEGNAINKMMLVTVEKVDDMFMMYDSVNNTFMSQGTTRAELWAKAKLRYPGLELITVDGTM